MKGVLVEGVELSVKEKRCEKREGPEKQKPPGFSASAVFGGTLLASYRARSCLSSALDENQK
ncbi:hypothetical protein [Diaphorobacter aerolatus]|uniref:Uncharacterized protein n=1 Tax=Diaphorobacter aerolatus TaxID=1288495 RepID=A0A7H0GHI3_9BURK|nr:hypothetical protein [Diaphorobacter aerolatus]QNP47749.1 hypothetical protein H9K75_16425 [Diaphorobacter aerolatus]